MKDEGQERQRHDNTQRRVHRRDGMAYVVRQRRVSREIMSSQYIADYIKEQEYEAASEREWREREGTEIPAWMDEEVLTARAYESQGL